jgi:type I restriction enzyme S subunit
MNLTSPKNWKTVKLGELADVKGGKRLPLGSDLVSYKTEHPYIRVTDIQDGKIKKDQLQFVTDDVFEKISRYIVNTNDLIISIVGSVGFVAYVDQDLHKASLTENCIRLTEYKKDIDPKFLFWYLISRMGQHDIASKTVGSTQPKLPIYNIRDLEIPVPSIEDQREIAAILGSLDDKIELLRRENKTLESIAQAMFKEWFVDFRFPGYEGVKLVDGMPEGWKVGKLGELFKITMGQSPSGESYNENKEGMIFYQGRTEFGDRFPSVRLYTTEPKRVAEKFDVLVSVRAPVGDLNQATEQCCLGRGVAGVSSDLKSFCFYMMKSIQSDIQKFEAGGTVFGSINKDDFGNIQVIVPSREIQEEFDQTIHPTDQKIFNNFSEIQTLSRLRDELLNNIFSE